MPRSKKEKIVLGITFVIFTLYAISLVYPLIWVLLNSFKSASEFFENLWGLPSSLYLKNYSGAFSLEVNRTNLLEMFGNSLILVVGCTAVSVIVPMLSAYVIARFNFRGRGFIYSVAIAAMLIPTVGTLSATYKLMIDLQLYGTHLGVIILSSGGFGFNFIMLHGFFRNISNAYAESAKIDGATDFRVFRSIMVPQVLPSVMAISIISAINYWNDYFTPYMYLRDFPTVAVGLQYIVAKMNSQSNWPQLFAVMLISIVPVIVVFSAFQKTIMENTVAGGLKG